MKALSPVGARLPTARQVESLFIQVTLLPSGTVSVAGTKPFSVINTSSGPGCSSVVVGVVSDDVVDAGVVPHSQAASIGNVDSNPITSNQNKGVLTTFLFI